MMSDDTKRAAIKKRVGLLDELRGLSILLMVVYHAFFDLVYIFGVKIPAFHSPLLAFLQPFFAGIFIFISGAACRYSKSNLKRGALCFGLGLAFTVITALFMPSELILFGILHFLGVAMMLFALLHRVLDKLPPWLGLPLCVLLFSLTYRVSQGYLGLAGFSLSLPGAWYQTPVLFFLGLPEPGFFSADYFPLLPWLFLFFAGAYFGASLKENRLPPWFYRSHIPPLAFIGRHTLLVYVLHQPVVYGVLYVIFFFIRR